MERELQSQDTVSCKVRVVSVGQGLPGCALLPTGGLEQTSSMLLSSGSAVEKTAASVVSPGSWVGALRLASPLPPLHKGLVFSHGRRNHLWK